MPISAPPPKISPRQKYIPSPDAAGLLSFLLPGLGQVWSGEKRKGALFMLAHTINLSALLSIVCAPYVLSYIESFGQSNHMKLNIELSHSFSDLGPGSPSSLILALMLLSFAMFAARDAFDHNAQKRRQAIYHDYVLNMPEATSGSYIFHVSFLLACLVLAFFFLIPPAPRSQVTVIEFQQNEENTREKVVSNKRAEHASKAAGHHDPHKSIELSGARSTAQLKSQSQSKANLQETQKETQRQTQPQPANPSPTKAAEHPVKVAEQPAPPSHVTPIPHPQPSVHAVTGPIPTPTAPTAQPKSSVPLPAVPQLTAAMPPRPQMPLLPAPTVIAQSRFAPAPVAISKIAMGTPGPVLPASAVKASSNSGSGLPTPVTVNTARSNGTVGGTSNDPNNGLVPMPLSTRGPSGNSHGSNDGSLDGPAPRKSEGNLASVPGVGPGPIGIGRPILGNNQSGARPDKGNSINTNADPNNRDGNAIDVGVDINWSPYMADLQRRIKRCWFPPRHGETKRVKVVFSLTKNGELINLRLVKSSDLQLADSAALKAVESAAPFRPLPVGAPSSVDIEFTFDYNVFGGSGSFSR